MSESISFANFCTIGSVVPDEHGSKSEVELLDLFESFLIFPMIIRSSSTSIAKVCAIARSCGISLLRNLLQEVGSQ